MTTTIESMTGVMVKSPFFSTPTQLELFPVHSKVLKNPSSLHRYRVALMYGHNGSGKSTIAQGFREYAESKIPRTVDLSPMSGSTLIKLSPGMKSEKFFVFDESYVAENIKMKNLGLGTIVLFGKHVHLEQRMNEIIEEIGRLTGEITQQEEICKKYALVTNIASPQYWISKITKILQDSNGWAETGGIKIKKNQIKTRVTEKEIERIGSQAPSREKTEIETDFNQLLAAFDGIESSSSAVEPVKHQIIIPDDVIASAEVLFNKIPQQPQISPREQELLELMGIDVVSKAKGFLYANSNKICPTCLQPISESHRTTTIKEIESILNKELEEFISKLQTLNLKEVDQNLYLELKVIDSTLYTEINLQINQVNSLILKYNEALGAKISDPFSVVCYEDSVKIIDAHRKLKDMVAAIEQKRLTFNQVIADRENAEKTLLKLNDEMGYYAIKEEYDNLNIQKKEKQLDNEKLTSLQADLNILYEEQSSLDAQRKSFKIAVAEINKSLSYIFCDSKRLELTLDSDETYHLTSNGHSVTPDKISCGERNALALSYFFTQIAKETELANLYSDEMFLVIDDPVSSFDVENRVGILSFLRYKLNQVLTSCTTTKIMIMTHDISVLFDLQKAMDEVSSFCSSCGKNAEYNLFQLQSKALTPFLYKSHNEYTRLLQCVYEYSCNPTLSQDLTIGNTIRRVLEAFATFSFKEGIEKVSLNPSVMALITDKNKKEYFQNSMYRLVLNTESHFQEAIQGAPETSFFGHLSTSEKQRTAKDILCFMYSLNPVHTLAHLPNAKNDIEEWLSNIS